MEFAQELGELINSRRRYFVRVAHRYVGDWAEAEDIVQDAALRALTHSGQFRTECSLFTWFYTILRSVAANHYRSRFYGARRASLYRSLEEPLLDRRGKGTGFSVGDTIPDTRPIPGEISSEDQHSERLQFVAASVETLPKKHRRVFDLRHKGGLHLQEIAEQIGVHQSNVSRQLDRIHGNIRTAYEAQA